ncbi:MAG: PilW family protein [Xanthomonadales bacterium]
MRARALQIKLPGQQGMLLAELLLAVLLSAFLVLGLVQIVAAARSSFRLQENEAEVQENGRHAIATLGVLIHQAGFSPQPWNESFKSQALTSDTRDRVSSRSDRLALRSWSALNCFDNRNPIEDESGEPAFFIRESVFDLNSRRDLTHTCRYGPTVAEFITQIRRQGFIRNVESFQVLYGEDRDHDGSIDRWVRGGQWSDEKQVLGVRLGLLLGSSDVVVEQVAQDFSILDFQHRTRADGRLHRLLEFTVAIKGRSG